MNINHLVKKAVKENKVKELLQGEGEYCVGFDLFVGAVAPTDWTIIIPELYKINKEEPQWNVSKLFENTLIDLFNGSPQEIFVGVGTMYVQILREEGNRADFFIDRKTILSLCKKALMREELRDSYIVVQNIQLSIWPEIERYAMLLKKKWKIEVI